MCYLLSLLKMIMISFCHTIQFLEECGMNEIIDALWAFFEQEVVPQIVSFQLNDPDQTSPSQVGVISLIITVYI